MSWAIGPLTCCLLLAATATPVEEVKAGKVGMVVENNLSVIDDKNEVQHFDIGKAQIYRNGLPTQATALVPGDWVTVTYLADAGRNVAILVEAQVGHHARQSATLQ